MSSLLHVIPLMVDSRLQAGQAAHGLDRRFRVISEIVTSGTTSYAGFNQDETNVSDLMMNHAHPPIYASSLWGVSKISVLSDLFRHLQSTSREYLLAS